LLNTHRVFRSVLAKVQGCVLPIMWSKKKCLNRVQVELKP
jgi:hypothetical protein